MGVVGYMVLVVWFKWWYGHAIASVMHGRGDRVIRVWKCSLVAVVGMVCMNANGFSNAKVFSLVNELRIIKKSNLLKISTSLYGWYYDIKIDLSV
jgi:hypothetical protein